MAGNGSDDSHRARWSPCRRLNAGPLARLLTWVLMACSPLATLDARETVYFGGAAFTGAISDATAHIPLVHAAIGDSGLEVVNQQLLGALAARQPQHFKLDYTELAKLDGAGSSMAMAIAIDRETITIDQIGTQYKLLFEIAAQVLFFDFRERMVRFAYPVTIQRIEVLEAVPPPDHISALARDMVLGRSPASLGPAVADALYDMRLPDTASRRIQVVDVSWSDKVATDFPQIARRAEAGIAGHEFSKILSGGLELGLLPYRPGHAIGNVMAARFSDGRVFNLTIPRADYEIRLVLQDFRSGVIKESPAFRHDLLGAFFDIHVEEPVSGRSYLGQPLRFGTTKTVPATQTGYDKDHAYYEALIAGLATFTLSIAGNGADRWVSEQPNARELRANLRSVRELISKCR